MLVDIKWIDSGQGGLPRGLSSIPALDQIMNQSGFDTTSCKCKNCNGTLYRVKPQRSYETKAPKLYKKKTQIELFNVMLCPDCGTFYAGVKRLDAWYGDPMHSMQLYLVSKRYDRDKAIDIFFDLKRG